jgi:uncharacterized protein GlcG (DUF336 family)
MEISQSCTDAALAAAAAEANAIGVPMNVAIMDAGANLKAFLRMDGALLGSLDIALRKARTAALFGMNRKPWVNFASPAGPRRGSTRPTAGSSSSPAVFPFGTATGS